MDNARVAIADGGSGFLTFRDARGLEVANLSPIAAQYTTLKTNGKLVYVPVTCPAPKGTCKVEPKLTLGKGKTLLTLAAGKFTLAAGATKTLGVPLKAAGASLLASGHGHFNGHPHDPHAQLRRDPDHNRPRHGSALDPARCQTSCLPMTNYDVKEIVKDRYAQEARRVSSAPERCCGAPTDAVSGELYDDAEAAQTSASALARSLGCGNPTLLADLRPGQVVLDLGSGAGLDVLLSARRVAPTGKAYGLDMTPEMLELARRYQTDAGSATPSSSPAPSSTSRYLTPPSTSSSPTA